MAVAVAVAIAVAVAMAEDWKYIQPGWMCKSGAQGPVRGPGMRSGRAFADCSAGFAGHVGCAMMSGCHRGAAAFLSLIFLRARPKRCGDAAMRPGAGELT